MEKCIGVAVVRNSGIGGRLLGREPLVQGYVCGIVAGRLPHKEVNFISGAGE